MAKETTLRVRVTRQQKEEVKEFWQKDGWSNESEFLFFVVMFYIRARKLGILEKENQREEKNER